MGSGASSDGTTGSGSDAAYQKYLAKMNEENSEIVIQQFQIICTID